MPQVVSANRLTDGLVVFLADGGWVESLASAALFNDKAALEAGVARANAAVLANLVVDVLPVEVAAGGKGWLPTHIRDRIRAAGPTVRLDHGKQAAGI